MVHTRSMSKTDTNTATDTKIVVRASKQTRKKARKNADYYLKPLTIDTEAMCIFMEDYMIRHPVPNIIPIPIDAIDFAGQGEWNKMSALEKAPFIKTAMERREKRAKPAYTRSMSKTDTKTASDTKIVVRASKQTRKKARKNVDYFLKRPTIDREAMCIFMEDYMIRHPVPNIIPIPIDAIDFAGQDEWNKMSALEKAPFIKTVMERREKRAKPAY